MATDIIPLLKRMNEIQQRIIYVKGVLVAQGIVQFQRELQKLRTELENIEKESRGK